VSAAAKKLRAVPPPSADPIADAQAKHARASELLTRARTELTAQRQTEQAARQRFDGGDTSVTVDDLARIRELRESAERKHAAAEEGEHKSRLELLDLEKARASSAYAEHIGRATSWRARMGAVLARIATIDEELARAVEDAADVIADAADAHAAAVELEAVVRPLVSLAARQITPPTLADARHLAQVHVARERLRAGRDELADGWLDQKSMPQWQNAERERWSADNKALDEIGRSAEEKKP
jgi:hypothetical protein